jgi:hypothetical protein
MKSLALFSLIPFVLAYGGKPRKALPKTVPLDDDYESLASESFWDHYGAKPGKDFESLENDFDNRISSDGFDYDDLRAVHGGKLRKALPKSHPVDDDIDERALPEMGSLFESETFRGFKPRREVPQTAPFLNEFGEDELAESAFNLAQDLELEDGYDRPVLQVTVPIADSHGPRKAFPKPEIAYQMGTKVLTDDVAIYIIYYGKWETNQKDLINDFTSSLGDSCKFHS